MPAGITTSCPGRRCPREGTSPGGIPVFNLFCLPAAKCRADSWQHILPHHRLSSAGRRGAAGCPAGPGVPAALRPLSVPVGRPVPSGAMDPNPGRSIPSGTGGAGAGRPVPLHPAHYHLPHCLPLCPAARLEAQNLRECHPAVGPLGRGFGLRQRLGDPAAAERGPCPFAGRAAPGPVSGGGGYAAGSLVPGAPPRRRLSAAPDPVQPDSQPPGRQPADSGAGPCR